MKDVLFLLIPSSKQLNIVTFAILAGLFLSVVCPIDIILHGVLLKYFFYL